MTAREFAELDDGFVRLAPFEAYDEPTNWHYNGGIGAYAGSALDSDGSYAEGAVLQRADASPEWLVVVVGNDGGGWTFRRVALSGLPATSIEDAELDDPQLDIIETAAERSELTPEGDDG